MNDFEKTLARIRMFRDARDWMQFHNPKNLSISICLEASELLEHFQWKTMEESEAHAKAARAKISEEIADVAIYLLELADNLGVDLLATVNAKLAKNEAKYPVAKAKGSAKKYTQLN
jgi:dCTP diphosphatase